MSAESPQVGKTETPRSQYERYYTRPEKKEEEK
jgi:hypothetical protein